jgi:hypothetical protein
MLCSWVTYVVAKFYPEDGQYLVNRELTVSHFEVAQAGANEPT